MHVIPDTDDAGAENQALLLLRALAERGDLRLEVVYFGEGRAHPRFEALGIPLRRLSRRGRLATDFPRRVRALRRLYSDDPPALLHTWLFEANAIGLAAARGLRGTRVVVGQRSGTMEREMRGHFAAMRLLYRGAAHAISNSREGAALLRDLGLAEESITVVAQGVGEERLTTGRSGAEVRQALGLPGGAPLVVSVGRADQTKDYPTLFGAMERVWAERPDVRLALVGPAAEQVEALGLALPERAVAAGWQERPADFLAAADVVAISSWTEGNSNVAAEALMLGRPVAATDTGDHPAVVREAGGRVVPIRDPDALGGAIAALLADSPAPESVREAAGRRLSVQAGVDATAAVYERLLRAPGAGGRGLRVAMLLENNAYPADVRVRNEAEALARAGHEVTVIAPRAAGQPAREEVAGVRVRRFRLPETPDTVAGIVSEYAIAHLHLYARGAAALARGADVVHMHNPPDTLFGVALLARALGRRAVFDHHDLGPELFEAKFGAESRLVAALRAAQRASVRSVDLAIATNESQRELLTGLGRNGRPQVALVRNGPRAGTIAEAAPARAGALDDPRLVFLGTLGAQDGVDRLPELMRSLASDHGMPGATLTVIGDGPRAAPLADAFAAAGMSDRVRLLGWVAHDAVPGLLAEADICLDPAECTPLNHGSTMIKVSEYLAAHRPLVAHELRETRRTAGEAALYVGCDGDGRAFAEQVARLARDPELRRRLAERAAARVPELVWERSEEQLLAAYETLARR